MPAGVMNRNAKVGLFVLGIVALGIFLADQSAITPHKQLDPIFIMIMLVIGAVIWDKMRAQIAASRGDSH